jgi:hypothetical protein
VNSNLKATLSVMVCFSLFAPLAFAQQSNWVEDRAVQIRNESMETVKGCETFMNDFDSNLETIDKALISRGHALYWSLGMAAAGKIAESAGRFKFLSAVVQSKIISFGPALQATSLTWGVTWTVVNDGNIPNFEAEFENLQTNLTSICLPMIDLRQTTIKEFLEGSSDLSARARAGLAKVNSVLSDTRKNAENVINTPKRDTRWWKDIRNSISRILN